MEQWDLEKVEDWEEDAERINALALSARSLGVAVPVGARVPKLAEDGSILSDITNVFCPTGKGGGIDPTCGKGGVTTKAGETLLPVTRGENKKWTMADGKEVPEHIQKLGIPPAWKDVHVNLNSKGDLLARGTDAKGRLQVKYSDSHNAQAAAAKFGRTRELIQKRKEIFKEVKQDAKSKELKEKAECLQLVMQTGMRPGSTTDTKADYKSYGATTLLGKHVVTKSDGSVSLKLVTGKNKGREVEFPIGDKSTAKMLQRRSKKAGSDGNLFEVSAGELRTYSKVKDGGGFKTKDHRTAIGTETAVREIKSLGLPKTKKQYKESVKQVATKVSQTLGNTPAIALKSYIDPQVFSRWRKSSGV